MNEVFAGSGKLRQGQVDKDGRVYNTADLSSSPAPAPQIAPAPAAAPQTASATTPAKTAMVPLPERSPIDAPAKPKPSGIAGLIDNIFGGKAAVNAAPAETDNTPGPAHTEMAAKPKRTHEAARRHTAHTTVQLRRSVTAGHKTTEHEAMAHSAPAATRQQAAKKTESAKTQPAASPSVKNAYSAPVATSDNGTMNGAQPVVQAGSFDARWRALH